MTRCNPGPRTAAEADRSLSPAPHRVPCPSPGPDASAHLSLRSPTTHTPTNTSSPWEEMGAERKPRREDQPPSGPGPLASLTTPSSPHDLGGSKCRDAHFTDAETEAQIGKVTWPESHKSEWGGLDSNVGQDFKPPKPVLLEERTKERERRGGRSQRMRKRQRMQDTENKNQTL